MFPLRDNIKASKFPYVTILIIVMNLLVFLREMMLGPSELETLVLSWSVVPARLLEALGGQGPAVTQLATVFSSMFLHGDLVHFLGNMWFLWIFGDNVED